MGSLFLFCNLYKNFIELFASFVKSSRIVSNHVIQECSCDFCQYSGGDAHKIVPLSSIWGVSPNREFCNISSLPHSFVLDYNYYNSFTAFWILLGTIWVSRYQKKHSSTHTYPDHQSSFILSASSICYDPCHSPYLIYVPRSFLHNLCPSFLWSAS